MGASSLRYRVLVQPGTNAQNGSGGTIQHKTGADGSAGAAPTSGVGVYLNNTKSVSLSSMNLHDFDNYGIFGFSVVINPMTPLHLAVLGLSGWALVLSLNAPGQK